jgi:hypothetical protein
MLVQEQHTVKMPSTVVGFATPGGCISANEMMMSNVVVIVNKACEQSDIVQA